MKVLESFDIKSNFWKINPQLIIPDAFADLYNSDKTKERAYSSKCMWGIALLMDTDSKFHNIPYNDRKKLIARDFIKKEDFDWNKLSEAIILYERLVLTPAKRQLFIWSKMMDEKTEYMSKLSYKSNGDEIEKLLLSNSKLFAELERITDQVSKDEIQGRVKGGIRESSTERGDI